MKNALRFGFSALAGTVLVAGALALPAQQAQQTPQPGTQSAAQTQSVSGKIASVDQNSFTLTVGSGSTVSESQTPATQTPGSSATANSTMSFTIDKNTTVEGKLKVGSTADVTYRQDGGSNVAISVHVTP